MIEWQMVKSRSSCIFFMYKKLNKFCEEIIDFTLDMLKFLSSCDLI